MIVAVYCDSRLKITKSHSEKNHEKASVVTKTPFDGRRFRFQPGRLDYQLISVYQLDSYADMYGETVALDVGKSNVSAYLTTDPSAVLQPLDLTRAFREVSHSGRIVEYADTEQLWTAICEQATAFASARRIDAEISIAKGWRRVYLAIAIGGHTAAAPTDDAWHLGRFVVSPEVFDARSLREQHKHDVAVVLSAISIALPGQAQSIVTVTDALAITWGDIPVFIQARPNPPTNVRVIGPFDGSQAETISAIARKMARSPEWETPYRVLADAMRRTNDRLECFLLAYAAIEMTISKLTSDLSAGLWVNHVPAELQKQAVLLHESIERRERKVYTFTEKLTAIHLMHGLREDVIEQIARIKQEIREPLYHRGHLNEDALPVDDVLRLAAELLGTVLRTL